VNITNLDDCSTITQRYQSTAFEIQITPCSSLTSQYQVDRMVIGISIAVSITFVIIVVLIAFRVNSINRILFPYGKANKHETFEEEM